MSEIIVAERLSRAAMIEAWRERRVRWAAAAAAAAVVAAAAAAAVVAAAAAVKPAPTAIVPRISIFETRWGARVSWACIDLARKFESRNDPECAIPIEPIRLSFARIIAETAKHFGITVNDIKSHRRTASVVRPRQVAMYLAKTLTLHSLPEVGRRFGDRDHTTVLHAVRKIAMLIEGDNPLNPALKADIEELKARLA